MAGLGLLNNAKWETSFSRNSIQKIMALRILVVACLVLGEQWVANPAFGQPLSSSSSELISTNAYWNVTDITDPGQPVGIGELQAAMGPQGNNTPWHVAGPITSLYGNPTNYQAFGITTNGGANGLGTVYALINNGLNISPNQVLVSSNVIYGTTYGSTNYVNVGGTLGSVGGSGLNGTIFKVNTDGSGFVTLHNFVGNDGAVPGGYNNNISPNGSLGGHQASLLLSDGMLYGTTAYGGPYGQGEVFRIKTDGTGFTVLHAFGAQAGNDNSPDGANPSSGLMLYGGVLYGTAAFGGTQDSGVAFSIKIDGTGFTVLHSFGTDIGTFSGATVPLDGLYPYSTLVLSGSKLYGTASCGGDQPGPASGFPGDGVVFSIDLTNNDEFTVIHQFQGYYPNTTDGSHPLSGLVLSGGMLYGTASTGGNLSTGYGGDGVVFSIDLNNGNNFTPIYTFPAYAIIGGSYVLLPDGGNPCAGLVLFDGTLYGTASTGGTTASGGTGAGVVFSVNINTGNENSLYTFTGGTDGTNLYAGLVLSDGTLYGSASSGGNSGVGGTLFSINTLGHFEVLTSFPPANEYSLTTIHSFPAFSGDGTIPNAQLAISGSTFYGIPPVVYGTTLGGGTNGYGTVFAMNSDGSNYMLLHSFTASDPSPQARLLISGGILYGTTPTTVFKINTDGSGFADLDSSINGASELVMGLSDTNLYGTTVAGGLHSKGQVFSLSTNGVFKDLYDFGTTASDGESPNAGLDLSPQEFYDEVYNQDQEAGVLYGTTKSGGITTSNSPGNGTVFSINTDGSGFQTLYTFGNTPGDGAEPEAGLVLATTNLTEEADTPDNILYGTTYAGGANGLGTVFSITTNGQFSTLYSFSGSDGSGPEGKLTILGNPSTPTLLGTTSGGGLHSKGKAFTLYNEPLTPGFTPTYTPTYDFSGSSDGASPNSGVTLDIGDHLDSVWSMDTALIVTNQSQVTNIDFYFEMADNNYLELYVNGNVVFALETTIAQNYLNEIGFFESGYPGFSSTTNSLHIGTNDIKAIIGGDGSGGYFNLAAAFNDSETYTPTAPTSLKAVPGDGDVTLTWTPVVGATSYNVYRSTTSGSFSTTPNFTTNSCTYTDTNVVNGTAYYYEGSAVDVGQDGPNSSQAGPVTPQGSPFLFVGNWYTGEIFGVNPDGPNTDYVTAGSGPEGLAFDGSGNLYVSAGSEIYVCPPGGSTRAFATGLNNPNGLAFDNAGNLYEADRGSGNIYKFAPNGTRTTYATGLSDPSDLAFDVFGDLFVTDNAGTTITEIAPGGTTSTFATGLDSPNGIGFDSAGNFYEADCLSGNVYEWASDGTKTTFASGLSLPTALTIDSANNVYVTEQSAGDVVIIPQYGSPSVIATGLGHPTAVAFGPTAYGFGPDALPFGP